MIVLTPTFGRDYRSVAQVKEDFDAGKEFLMSDPGSEYHLRYGNKEDLVKMGVKSVRVRFALRTKSTVLTF